MRSSWTAAPTVGARKYPTNLPRARASPRPAVKAAISCCGSNASGVTRMRISASAHRRQERDFIAVRHRAGQVMCHALVEDQPCPCRSHRLAQQRLLAGQPGLQVTEGMHIGRQRHLCQVCRRHLAKLAQKYEADHLSSGACKEELNHKPRGLAKEAQTYLIFPRPATFQTASIRPLRRATISS